MDDIWPFRVMCAQFRRENLDAIDQQDWKIERNKKQFVNFRIMCTRSRCHICAYRIIQTIEWECVDLVGISHECTHHLRCVYFVFQLQTVWFDYFVRNLQFNWSKLMWHLSWDLFHSCITLTTAAAAAHRFTRPSILSMHLHLHIVYLIGFSWLFDWLVIGCSNSIKCIFLICHFFHQ